ncbi:unnamed protein product, partial [Tetraodon nigroviridis]
DLYTFRPALSQSVFRLGRAAELCDVTLDSTSVSRIHAELHAQKETNANDVDQPNEGWTVHIRDRSTHGTWVNEVRLQSGVQWELSDGDTLTFGGQSAPGSSEFYFLFQRVRVRPLDFDAITIPKAGTFSSDLQDRIRTNLDRKRASNLDQSKLSINRATIILNSIGSLSKMKGSSWTFRRSHSHEGSVSDPGSSSSPPLAEGFSRLSSFKPAPFLSMASVQSTKCTFNPRPGAGGSQLIRCSSRMTVLMNRIVNEEETTTLQIGFGRIQHSSPSGPRWQPAARGETLPTPPPHRQMMKTKMRRQKGQWNHARHPNVGCPKRTQCSGSSVMCATLGTT